MESKNNQRGLALIGVLFVVITILVLGLAGYYVYTLNKSESDADKSGRIGNYNLASESLKKALLTDFYIEAKTRCEGTDGWPDKTKYITLVKMVRDDFALAQWCGSGANTILAKLDNSGWKAVADTSQAPQCTIVDQYKISKEATEYCYPEGKDEAIKVTYP